MQLVDLGKTASTSIDKAGESRNQLDRSGAGNRKRDKSHDPYCANKMWISSDIELLIFSVMDKTHGQ